MILIADMNHANPVDFAKIAAAGIGGVIHKVDQGLGFADMTMAMALEFLDRGDQILGRRIGIYGGDRIKRFVPGLRDAQRDFLGAHPLWGCEYGPVWKNVDVNGHPLPWGKPDLWQFTGDGVGPGQHAVDGLERGADLSRFEGDRAALAAWWPLPALPTL
jgi:GH25 family lysozyme M1 (1,4-beta-N-acetylmuramidase)